MTTLEQARERDAKLKAAFFRGETDKHPHGASGWIIPREEGRNMWDTAPYAFRFSPWANIGGGCK